MSLRAGTLLLIMMTSLSTAFGDGEDPLAEANALYRNGEFEHAAETYADALANGHDGATVHYNLANALYHCDRHGEAIAHYMAAATIAPRDDDIQANLDSALAQRPAGMPVPPASWLHAATKRVVGAFTLSEFAVAAALIYWVAVGLVIAPMLEMGKRRRLRRLAIVLGACALVLTGLAFGRWWTHHRIARAVVATESAQIRTGPGPSFETAQSVGEGWTMRVLDNDARWVEVIDEAGVHGWVSSDALIPVKLSGGEGPQ